MKKLYYVWVQDDKTGINGFAFKEDFPNGKTVTKTDNTTFQQHIEEDGTFWYWEKGELYRSKYGISQKPVSQEILEQLIELQYRIAKDKV